MLTAVIFDMDGVLIDSEPFWQRAQMAVFSELGHPHTVEDCESTIGVRIDQLVAHWYRLRPWSGPSQEEVVQRILDRVNALILSEGQAKAGVLEALDLIEARGLKVGLATSSPLPWWKRCSASSAFAIASWRSTPPRWSASASRIQMSISTPPRS